MQPEWWHWAVAGIVLILAELAVPAFVLVWFGLGALIVALIVGRLERTGPITWGLPFSANLVLRQLGLVFFLAAIGTRAVGIAGTVFGDVNFGWLVVEIDPGKQPEQSVRVDFPIGIGVVFG